MREQKDKITVYVLSTSHWDREWYQPFEQYRFRLVRMLDELIDILESDPAYRCFHLDGQTIPLYDYLEIRPENEARLRKLVKEKRILVGPWYTMPDEFLISGEGLVRNLQKGQQVCADFATESCKNGYICDIFGHNSQMPQIFSGFGLDSTAFFRGRKGYEKTEFMWKGADGSKMLVHKQHPDYAYSSFFFVARWPYEDKEVEFADMAARVQKYLEAEKPYFASNAHIMFDGVDHIDPERRLPEFLRELNARLPEYEFVHSDFADYTAQFADKKDGLDEYAGALYEPGAEGVNNAVLKNVLSSIVPLKQSNDRAESHLTLITEPLDFFVKHKADCRVAHTGFLNHAWDLLLQNQPHDSICGCSITATHLDCQNRFKRIDEIVKSVDDDILADLSAAVTTAGKGKDGAFVVINPSQVAVNGPAEVKLCFMAGKHQRMFRFYDCNGNELPYNITAQRKVMKKQADFKKLIRFFELDEYTVVLDLQLAPYAYTTITYDILRQDRDEPGNWKFTRFDAPNRYLGSMRTAAAEVDNGVLVVKVQNNGALQITDKRTGKQYNDMMVFEDGSDVGDGWNLIPSPYDCVYGTTADGADVAVEADLPNLTRFKIVNRMHLPETASYEGGRNGKPSDFFVTSHVTIRRGDTRIDIKTEVDNSHDNHRLRVIFPTGMQTDTFKTQLPYDLYSWPIKPEDNSHAKEFDTLVHPNQGAVRIEDGKNTLAVYNKGLYEVSVLDRADRPVCLTLFRCFPNETSEYGADMGRLQRSLCFEYALDFAPVSDGETVRRANAFKCPPISVPADCREKGKLPACGEIATITGGAVLSAMYEQGDYLCLRLYDLDGGSKGEVKLPYAVTEVYESDLKGEKKGKVACKQNGFAYSLGAKKIATYLIKIQA